MFETNLAVLDQSVRPDVACNRARLSPVCVLLDHKIANRDVLGFTRKRSARDAQLNAAVQRTVNQIDAVVA
jgi:hypothetical protein